MVFFVCVFWFVFDKFILVSDSAPFFFPTSEKWQRSSFYLFTYHFYLCSSELQSSESAANPCCLLIVMKFLTILTWGLNAFPAVVIFSRYQSLCSSSVKRNMQLATIDSIEGGPEWFPCRFEEAISFCVEEFPVRLYVLSLVLKVVLPLDGSQSCGSVGMVLDCPIQYLFALNT